MTVPMEQATTEGQLAPVASRIARYRSTPTTWPTSTSGAGSADQTILNAGIRFCVTVQGNYIIT